MTSASVDQYEDEIPRISQHIAGWDRADPCASGGRRRLDRNKARRGNRWRGSCLYAQHEPGAAMMLQSVPRILLVDDLPDDREIYGEGLTLLGFGVTLLTPA